MGLAGFLERLAQIDFLTLKEIRDMPQTNFVVRENKRPPGYSAMTRVHISRLCVPLLNDTWGHVLLYNGGTGDFDSQSYSAHVGCGKIRKNHITSRSGSFIITQVSETG